MSTDIWQATNYANHASYVSQLSQKVMQDLAPQPGERILDLGCGDGELAKVMLDLGCDVVGIDSSQNMVEAAQQRGVDARVVDAQQMEFSNEFDAVFSNAALHWMPEQAQLIQRAYLALKTGGRFVVEMGGQGNIAILCSVMESVLADLDIDFASRNPWTFPSSEEQQALLQAAGFTVESIALRDRPTELPTDVRGWFVTFTQGILSDLDEAQRAEAIDRMVELSQPQLCDQQGQWYADYKRLNFVAIKQG